MSKVGGARAARPKMQNGAQFAGFGGESGAFERRRRRRANSPMLRIAGRLARKLLPLGLAFAGGASRIEPRESSLKNRESSLDTRHSTLETHSLKTRTHESCPFGAAADSGQQSPATIKSTRRNSIP